MKNIQPRKKKHFGQHFLRNQRVVDSMIENVTVTPKTSVLEIGCGDGFLTRSILEQTPCKNLFVYEIDEEWAHVVQNEINDKRLIMHITDVLDTNWSMLEKSTPLIMLANLPYQITFPILFKIQKYKHLFTHGIVMIQEEVAQKIVATRGKKYSPTSLFLQDNFSFKLLDKVPPGSFIPPPKVFSRLIFFEPKKETPLKNKEEFWKFVRLCFRFPRQTLKNNLKSTHYDATLFSEELLKLRAQQLSFDQLVELWSHISE